MDENETGGFRISAARAAILSVIIAVLAFAGGLSLGATKGSSVFSSIPLIGDQLDATPDPSADLGDFWKAWNLLSDRFVQTHSSTTPSLKERMWGAIAGLAASYGDPYTVFMPPTEAKMFQEDISGNFEGVGMEIGIKNDVLTVIAPLKKTPAERAGIRSGDQIIAIDEKPTDGLSTDEAVKLIRGKKGTAVKLHLVRDGEVMDISVVRDRIDVPVIDSSLDPSGVYVISLYSFTSNSATMFDRALTEFRNSGSRLLLIDLRGNPGGFLEAAVSMASHFLPKDTVIVTEDHQGKGENRVHVSAGTLGLPEGTKVAILIDQGSASASEILAGALQDEKIATLIGMRSFGKGSVQELVTIDGGSLKITTARWLTPSGRSISDGGLTPDIKVEVTEEDITAANDVQKKRAIEFLTTGN